MNELNFIFLVTGCTSVLKSSLEEVDSVVVASSSILFRDALATVTRGQTSYFPVNAFEPPALKAEN